MQNSIFKTAGKLEIQEYRAPKDPKVLKNTHVPYTGSPKKHPYDAQKCILVCDPFSTNTNYYEFGIDDIGYVEKLPTLVDSGGNNVPMARVWIKKKSYGVLCSPFMVEDTSK